LRRDVDDWRDKYSHILTIHETTEATTNFEATEVELEAKEEEPTQSEQTVEGGYF
jgi:hypothetical protein